MTAASSPDLHFLLALAVRMAVAAAFVVTASIATERSGPVIGALIATLPVSAGPSYLFLAIDHDDAFIAQAALASLPMNAATALMSLVVMTLARSFGVLVSIAAGLATWLGCALLVRSFPWTLAGGVAFNVLASALCLPLAQRFRVAKMPRFVPRWYDIPLRAALVAVLVATVVSLSNILGPYLSGILAAFPVVYTSLIVILMPRIGPQATAAVLANGQWGLVGFGAAIAVVHLAALPLGRAAALSLALATCVVWNFGLFLWMRRRRSLVGRASRPD
jgi:hypothetical protein